MMHSDLTDVETRDLVDELTRRNLFPRCTCSRWQTYVGAYDQDGLTLRCCGCLRAIASCTCR